MENDRAMQDIQLFRNALPRNLIFIGEEKNTMRQCALSLAAEWLVTTEDDILYHPDFKMIEAESGIIRAEQAETIQRMATYIPQSDRSICIVTDANTMTAEMQNKLLKVLEDREDTLAVIFVTSGPLLETISSRCVTIVFDKIPLGELYASSQERVVSAILASDGSPELYRKILDDDWFCQYLEGFTGALCGIKERSKLKNILRLTHAVKEKDKEYLPEKFEDWQLQAFLRMLSMLYWEAAFRKIGCERSTWVRLGNLPELYSFRELYRIYEKTEWARNAQKRKGGFTQNEFFELLMVLIPLEE